MGLCLNHQIQMTPMNVGNFQCASPMRDLQRMPGFSYQLPVRFASATSLVVALRSAGLMSPSAALCTSLVTAATVRDSFIANLFIFYKSSVTCDTTICICLVVTEILRRPLPIRILQARRSVVTILLSPSNDNLILFETIIIIINANKYACLSQTLRC